MSFKILYKFPSRQRPHKFFGAVDNIHELSAYYNFEILATLDIDDPMMANEQVKEKLLRYPRVRAMYGTSISKIHSCNRDMEFSGAWDICILMSDDQKFLINGFDIIIAEMMQKYFPDTDGVLHFPDSHGKHELCVLSIVGRKYYDRFNYLYNPEYQTMFCDNEFTDVARILNRYAFIPIKIFDHYHHIWGMAQKDELNIKNDNMNLYVQDNQTYLRNKAKNFGLYTL